MKLARVFPLALVLCALGGCQEPPAVSDADGPDSQVAADKTPATASQAHDEDKDDKDDEEGCIHEPSSKSAAADKAHDGSCDHGSAAPGSGDKGHYGTPFAIAEPKPLSKVLGEMKLGEESSEPVLVSGTVANVCKKKGCWMVIQDGDATARVLMKDHAFSVPMDSEGRPAKVEGTLKVRTYNEAQVKHLAKDGGENTDEVSGTRTEFELTASGVAFEQS